MILNNNKDGAEKNMITKMGFNHENGGEKTGSGDMWQLSIFLHWADAGSLASAAFPRPFSAQLAMGVFLLPLDTRLPGKEDSNSHGARLVY